MIQKTTLSVIRFILFFSIFLGTKTITHAQTIVPQPLDGLEKLCAGSGFNEFYATFGYVNFPAGTTFTAELLDASNNPIATTFLDAVDVSATQKTVKFAVPVNLVGSDTYGIRVKSSTGVVSPRFKNSLGATSFPAYYKEFESKFSINNKGINAAICSSGSITLSVDNDTPTVPASSPANYPNLKYRWYKDNAIIAGQTTKTLTVNAVGDYYVIIEYGACTDVNISSNHVNVVSSASGSAATISSSLGNPFCSNGTGTVLTATTGNSYVWKKDGAVISGATGRNYTTNESGTYTVDIDFGGCKATGSINLSASGFNASIDVADTVELNEGETINVSVTTDATSPTYEWFLNDNLIAGATSNSYLVAAVGNYKAKISQATGCIATKEFVFKITGPAPPTTVIPNIVNLSGSYPYWNIPDVYKTASTKVTIISSNGEIMFNDVGSNYDPQVNSFIKDFKNVNPVYYYVIQADTGEKKGSITVIK
ncbi:gliding motility protein SprC [Flavobacterium daemonense]|uniref:gliding motility protein SprC n=1 Tax=Flavobacterium daemonense TaxID=1393049 RepID=UPI0011871132|nr:gliding motility protein SprC [Flavobacterium daemonense]KAF2336502.1 gliding motility protein SprC [Flavobacterium daemonense]